MTFGKSVIPEPSDISFHKDMSDADFLSYVKAKNEIGMQLGLDWGWWESIDRKGPVPFPKIFHLTDFEANATLAHVMAKAEIFDSVTTARKNGWNKPICTGEWTVGKPRQIVKVID